MCHYRVRYATQIVEPAVAGNDEDDIPLTFHKTSKVFEYFLTVIFEQIFKLFKKKLNNK